MKMLLSLLLISSTTLITGCYTVLSLNEDSEELVEPADTDTQYSGSYFDEDIYEEDIDSIYDYADKNLEEENTEPSFFEILLTELISGLSNVSYSEDVIIYSEDSGTDNSSASNENSTKERDNSSTRNSGDRNYSHRK